MKINKKALVAVLLAGSMLLSACVSDNSRKSKHKGKKEKKVTSHYTVEDIEGKTNARELEDGVYFSEDCYVVRSNNKYNNVRFIVFDSDRKAEKFYEEAVDSYLTGVDEEGDNYSIGYEYGVCDASIIDMILVDKNIVLVAEVAMYGDWAYVEGDEYEPAGTVYLNEDQIAKIVAEWS